MTRVKHGAFFASPERKSAGWVFWVNHDEYGQMYRLEDTHWWFVARRRLIESYLRLHTANLVQSDVQVLDVGCGTGGMLDRIKRFGSGVGLDLEDIALDFCRERGWRTLVQGSATALPFGNRTFDAVVALDVLEHIPDDVGALREIARVLAPGGIALITVPAYKALWSRHDIALMHQRRYRADELSDLICESGLKIEYLSYTVAILFPLVVLVRSAQRIFQSNAAPRADLRKTGRLLNWVLTKILELECRLHHCSIRLPFGLSVFAVARRI